MSNFQIVYHPKFFKELQNLTKGQLEVVHKKIEQIKHKPEQAKDLKGNDSCYTIRIENMRLVYYFDKVNLWFLIIESRKSVYEEYLKRLYTLKMKLR